MRAGGGIFGDIGESVSESIDVGAVSDRMQAIVDDFAIKHHLDEKIRGRLATSEDEVVKKVVAKELSQRVHDANARACCGRRSGKSSTIFRQGEGQLRGRERRGGHADEAFEDEGGESADEA